MNVFGILYGVIILITIFFLISLITLYFVKKKTHLAYSLKRVNYILSAVVFIISLYLVFGFSNSDYKDIIFSLIPFGFCLILVLINFLLKIKVESDDNL